MGRQKPAAAKLQAIMDRLASADGMVRLKAREMLVGLGAPAVPALVRTLRHASADQVRWEAAKSLGAIGDARAIPVLVKALEDSNADVTWLAAEALQQFKMAAWTPLLRRLIRSGAKSGVLRRGAHHVLRNQEAEGFSAELATLRKALGATPVPGSITIAAYTILQRIQEKCAAGNAVPAPPMSAA